MAPTKLQPGDRAPGISLVDQHGATRTLEEFAGRKVLIFFYPKALTSGCTTQACGLRDIAGEIGDTVIVGVSPDEPDRQLAFDDKHGLGYPLLADTEHLVAEAYGAWGEKNMYGKKYFGVIRSAFLVSEDGAVEQAWYKISPKATPEKVLASLGADT